MVENIIRNNGLNIAISGLIVVFLGLILISLVIYGFNLFSQWLCTRRQASGNASPCGSTLTKKVTDPRTIPTEHLAAITAAIEVYRRIHFDDLQSEITFEKGDIQSAWKLGHRYGQRFSASRRP